MDIGSYIRKLRKEKGFTLIKLAELTDLSYSYLSQIETGKRGKSGISPEIFKKLSGPLEVSLSELSAAAGYTDTKILLEELILQRMIIEKRLDALTKEKDSREEVLQDQDSNLKVGEIETILEELDFYRKEENKLTDNLLEIGEKISREKAIIVENEETDINIVTFNISKFNTGIQEDRFAADSNILRENAKRRFLSLENLLTMNEDIYLNERRLTKEEKDKALNILKSVFD